VHFWSHAFPTFGTTGIETYGSFHPGLRLWQHPPICSVNHTIGFCASSPRHYGSYYHVLVKSIFGKLSYFIFYLTGLTGLFGFLFFTTFQKKVVKPNPPAVEKILPKLAAGRSNYAINSD
jgi:hypothetical protein